MWLPCQEPRWWPDFQEIEMPKITDIENTPNPNAVKFILKKQLIYGITRSYDNAEQAEEEAS